MKHSRLPLDLTNQRFGTLVAIREHPERSNHGQRQWVCACDCGTETIILQHSLRQGNTTKCDDHPRNDYTVDKGVAVVDVSTPSRPDDRTLIDVDDIDRVIHYRDVNGSRMRWLSHNSCTEGHDRWGVYVLGSDRKTRLHRMISGVTDRQLIIDHINGNTLDNRKANLRIITRAENNKNMRIRITNTSGATGVEFDGKRNNYTARIRLNDKTYFLGTYNTLAEAHAARKGAEKVLGFSERHGI